MEMTLACSKHGLSDGGFDGDVFKIYHVENAEDRYKKKDANMGKNSEYKITGFTFLLCSLSYLHIKPVHLTVLIRNREDLTFC
jgi:hypothetical protein